MTDEVAISGLKQILFLALKDTRRGRAFQGDVNAMSEKGEDTFFVKGVLDFGRLARFIESQIDAVDDPPPGPPLPPERRSRFHPRYRQGRMI